MFKHGVTVKVVWKSWSERDFSSAERLPGCGSREEEDALQRSLDRGAVLAGDCRLGWQRAGGGGACLPSRGPARSPGQSLLGAVGTGRAAPADGRRAGGLSLPPCARALSSPVPHFPRSQCKAMVLLFTRSLYAESY